MAWHWLLTGLGLNPRAGEYALAAERFTALLSSVALFHLLPEEKRPDGVIAFCTKKAQQDTFPCLQEALAGLATVEAVEVPDGISPEDVSRFLEAAVQAVVNRSARRLTLDLTQGPRHFALLLYLSALYLESLGNSAVEAVYYGFEFAEPRPFFDLKALLELPRWIHAIDTLTESRDAVPLADLLRRAKDRAPVLGDAAKLMSRATEAFASGLPIELGYIAEQLLRKERVRPLRKDLLKAFELPLAGQIVGKLEEWLDGYRLTDLPAGAGWKSRLRLTEDGLRRQARLIDDLLSLRNYRSALGLMDEWVVSWALLRLGQTANWLQFDPARRQAANRLGALLQCSKHQSLRGRLSPDQAALAAFWEDLSSLRNSLHHHGMRPQVVISDDPNFGKKLAHVCEFWENRMRQLPDISLEFAETDSRTVLVSPIGERPGVLFSALACLRSQGLACDAVLAICSATTAPHVAEALERAGWQGEHHLLRFEDPFAGTDERKDLIRQALPLLAAAASVYVNVTGGTTLMGLFAEELAGEARSLARPVRRFGLIDRRSAEEQRANPWVAGELIWLDGDQVGET